MAKVLVVGGAGYVGSAACAWLLDQGHSVWVLDDLSTGHRELILPGVSGFTEARCGDREAVGALLSRVKMDCVMHFAAKSLVAESVEKPQLYFENNVNQTQALLETMLEKGVNRFIFSSTCAIFGDPGAHSMNEACPKNPINPYGETKKKAEELMAELARTRGLQVVALRYFNACGAETLARVGEWHEPETHLIPRILKAASAGLPVEIYGTDYPTPDGTCIRDYIHVLDLAAAHEAALQRLMGLAPGGRFEAFNLGSENGYSVREIIEACEKVTGVSLQIVERERRPGDPARLVANSAVARKELHFKIRHSLNSILASAWHWERKRAGKLGKAIFLDRDGTLNEDPGYLAEPAQMKLLPGVGAALAEFVKAGYRLIVVSNQSGVGRGLIPIENLPKIHHRMQELLAPWAVKIDHYEFCTHHPDIDCECRKPKAKLLLDAGYRCGIDFAQSFMIGDKVTDLWAGRRSGCRGSILVRTGEGRRAEAQLKKGEADLVVDSLGAVIPWINSLKT